MKIFNVMILARVSTNEDFTPRAALNLAEHLLPSFDKIPANVAGSLRLLTVMEVGLAEPDDRV